MNRHAVILAGLALLLAPGSGFAQMRGWLGGQKNEAPSYTQPAENLLLIVADIQRHIRDDVYRFPYPKDVNGQNIFRAAIVRLSNYEKLYSGRMADVVSLAKAQAFERLCAFREAGSNYETAQKSKDASVKKAATDGFERVRQFSAAADQSVDRTALRPFERDLQKKIDDLTALSNKFQGTPHQCLAQVERERTQMQLAEFYITMRFMQPYSTKDALKQIKANLEANKAGKLRYAHHLMLANLHYDLAREYTILNDPEGPNFDVREFEAFANAARSELNIVEQADGFEEKQEGRALLTALEAFAERVTDRAQ